MQSTRTPQKHQQKRIQIHCQNRDSYSFFNLLTSEALLEQIESQLPEHRERLYPPTETLSMFLAQAMSVDRSCQNAANKKRRKRHNSPDSRGVLPGKRHISERPLSAENRSRIGHWEIDTVMGSDDRHCIVTLVERKTKYTLIAKLKCRTTKELNKAVIRLIKKQHRPVRTITADNGTEFHGFKDIEDKTGTLFYFATPHHSWERGLNENTNGLIRQYLPKGKSMAHITQKDCDAIATTLNRRPRKSLNYKTPEQCYAN